MGMGGVCAIGPGGMYAICPGGGSRGDVPGIGPYMAVVSTTPGPTFGMGIGMGTGTGAPTGIAAPVSMGAAASSAPYGMDACLGDSGTAAIGTAPVGTWSSGHVPPRYADSLILR